MFSKINKVTITISFNGSDQLNRLIEVIKNICTKSILLLFITNLKKFKKIYLIQFL